MYPRHSEKWMKPVMKELYKSFSYGKFLLENPNATREERQEAVKRFWEHSTGSSEPVQLNEPAVEDKSKKV